MNNLKFYQFVENFKKRTLAKNSITDSSDISISSKSVSLPILKSKPSKLSQLFAKRWISDQNWNQNKQA